MSASCACRRLRDLSYSRYNYFALSRTNSTESVASTSSFPGRRRNYSVRTAVDRSARPPTQLYTPRPRTLRDVTHSEPEAPDIRPLSSQSSSKSTRPESRTPSVSPSEHLGRLFPPLQFPEDVATRMLTHISYRTLSDVQGHNTRLSFIGRRVIHAYFLLFLDSCLSGPHPAMTNIPDYDVLSERALDTYMLGEYVGGAWELEKVMRWTPAITRSADPNSLLRSSGLYKVRGATVEAVMGGIFHQFGGAVSHIAFHTRLLPHLSRAIPKPLREHVDAAAERMGGRDGLLAIPQGGEGSAAPAEQSMLSSRRASLSG